MNTSINKIKIININHDYKKIHIYQLIYEHYNMIHTGRKIHIHKDDSHQTETCITNIKTIQGKYR